MPPKKEPGKLRAKQSFVCDVRGQSRVVHEREVVRAHHPAVAGRKELFEPVGTDTPPDIE